MHSRHGSVQMKRTSFLRLTFRFRTHFSSQTNINNVPRTHTHSSYLFGNDDVRACQITLYPLILCCPWDFFHTSIQKMQIKAIVTYFMASRGCFHQGTNNSGMYVFMFFNSYTFIWI